MTVIEIHDALGFILYNYCYHNQPKSPPLNSTELESINGPGEDQRIGRRTYCTVLKWAQENPDFDFSSILLSKRKELTNENTYQHLMAMLNQLEDYGILTEFDKERESMG